MFKKVFLVMTILCSLTLLSAQVVLATDVPEDSASVEYFYVFGADGDPLLGAEDNELTLFIDVPDTESSDLTIDVYDPDTGSHKDFRTDSSNEWDTVTEFSVYGSSLLDKKEFGEGEYNRRYYRFGPYAKSKGKKVGSNYRFKVIAKGLRGDDANLFRFRIFPATAESFSEDITIRLLHNEGDKMYFYPGVTAGTKYIVLENYDLDAKGGTSELRAGRHILTDVISRRYDIEDSPTGQWRKTKVPMEVTSDGRLQYIITKGTQKYAHAGLRAKDDKGRAIPIYFKKGETPVIKGITKPRPKVKAVVKSVEDLKCNKFTFDATDSYDIDNQALTFFWDFGDGSTSTDPVVTHLYEKGGQYRVTLTVTDNSGLDCDTATTTQTIKVNTPPRAAFSLPESACTGDTITLDATGTKDDTSSNLTYLWKLGDGTEAEGVRATKLFTKGGTYKVTLTVDDNEESTCSVDSITKSIHINTPPVADAGGDIDICLEDYQDSYKVTLNGSGTRDADNDRLTYIWNLGDGTTKEGRSITHQYERPGSYRVTLTVDDGTGSTCSSSTDSISVKLNKSPVADIHTRDSKICVGDEVIFDGSGSITEEGERLSYIWDFGDGTTGKGIKTTHAYRKGGRYHPRLTVDDGMGTRCSEAIATVIADVNTAPIARVSGKNIVCIGDKVTFDGSRSSDPDGDPLKYYWNFGDGSTIKGGSSQTHTYKKGGSYTVKLTVDDGRDYECSTAIDTVNIRVNTPPVASTGPNLACCVDVKTVFDASDSRDADGDRLSYSWDFGDGTTGSGVKVSHVYNTPGKYTVVVTVDDGTGTDCSKDSASFVATVNAQPVPIIKVR